MLYVETTSYCLPLLPRQLLQIFLSHDMIPEKQWDNFSNGYACSQEIQALLELCEHVHGVLRLTLHLLLSTAAGIAHAK